MRNALPDLGATWKSKPVQNGRDKVTNVGATSEYYHFEDLNDGVVRLFRSAQTAVAASPSVLDLGCGRARLGLEIERLGFTVTGIDGSAVACETARGRISEVIELDLMQREEIVATLNGRRFDWLLAADVLEHMRDSEEALKFYAQFLKRDGYLVLSLPNVAVWDNRLRLLFGRFNYTDSGVLDRTHLRFFTFRTAKQLVIDAGFTPLRVTWEPGIARAFLPVLKRVFAAKSQEPAVILDSSLYKAYSRYFLPIEHFICGIAPGLLAFRIVILAQIH